MVRESIGKKTNDKKIGKFGVGGVVKILMVAGLVLGIVLMVQKVGDAIVVGQVGNRVITTWELSSRLKERYGKTAMDELVTEIILMKAADENGIVVSEQEIENERSINVSGYGSERAFKDMALAAGISTDDQLKRFLKFKILVKKLQAKLFQEVVFEEEISKYYEDNKQYLSGRKFEDIKDDIEAQILSEKVSQKFSEWLSRYREQTGISINL